MNKEFGRTITIPSGGAYELSTSLGIGLGIATIVAQKNGEIPKEGPGSYSVSNAIEASRQFSAPTKTKQERRCWNLNNKLSPAKR